MEGVHYVAKTSGTLWSQTTDICLHCACDLQVESVRRGLNCEKKKIASKDARDMVFYPAYCNWRILDDLSVFFDQDLEKTLLVTSGH